MVREEQTALVARWVSSQQGGGEMEVLEIPVQQRVRVPEVGVAHLQGWGSTGEGGRSVIFRVAEGRGGANLPKRIEPHLGELGGGHIVKLGAALDKGEKGVN